MTELMIGQRVKVKDPGETYDTYTEFIKSFDKDYVSRWAKNQTPIKEGIITVIDKKLHLKYQHTMLYIVEDSKGKLYIMDNSNNALVAVDALTPDVFYKEIGMEK